MANVLLGVTGSVAAIKTPLLYAELRARGHQVKIVATTASTYFFDPKTIDPILLDTGPKRNPDVVILDADEWPGHAEGAAYRRDDDVLHITLRRWADLFVIAPLDANTLAKLAHGFADNCLTCVWRAWEPVRPVVLAPAMNTLMWLHPATARHLRQLADDAGMPGAPLHLSHDELIVWVNSHCERLRVIAPLSKRLACDDVGVGAMAEVKEIVDIVCPLLSKSEEQSRRV